MTSPFEEDEEEEEMLSLQMIPKGFFLNRAFSDIPVAKGVGITDVPPSISPHILEASESLSYSPSSPTSPELQQEIYIHSPSHEEISPLLPSTSYPSLTTRCLITERESSIISQSSASAHYPRHYPHQIHNNAEDLSDVVQRDVEEESRDMDDPQHDTEEKLSHVNVRDQRPSEDGDPDSDSDDEEEESCSHNDWDELELGPNTWKSYFRTPKSTEPCASIYNAVLPILKHFLHARYPDFLISLFVACSENATENIEIPYIFIGIPHDESSIPNADEFPHELRESSVGLVVCRFYVERDLAESSSRTKPYRGIRTGLSVGHEEKYNSTLGVLVKRTDGSFIGVTAGHLVEDGYTDSSIAQPSYVELKLEIQKMEEERAMWQKNINISRNEEERKASIQEKRRVDKELAEVKKFVGETSVETVAKIKVGNIIHREYQCVKDGNRFCLSDFLLFDIIPARQPMSLERWQFKVPNNGELGKGMWLAINGWDELSLDLHVRKNGATTGFTYGFVAGVKAELFSKKFPNSLSEFYVLEEQEVTNHGFSRPGDSGSGVVNREGKLVGLVIARAVFEKLEVLVHPMTKVPDIEGIKSCRRADGTLERDEKPKSWTGKPWFRPFTRIITTLIMCASVLESRSGIRGMGTLYGDS